VAAGEGEASGGTDQADGVRRLHEALERAGAVTSARQTGCAQPGRARPRPPPLHVPLSRRPQQEHHFRWQPRPPSRQNAACPAYIVYTRVAGGARRGRAGGILRPELAPARVDRARGALNPCARKWSLFTIGFPKEI
jgi:hypothetical protein